MKKARMEEENKIKTKEYLKAVDREMCLRRAERYQALIEKHELNKMLINAKMEARESQSQIKHFKQ
ncbi:hypothetical protein CR513_32911, partial [Mucuna pruriens]